MTFDAFISQDEDFLDIVGAGGGDEADLEDHHLVASSPLEGHSHHHHQQPMGNPDPGAILGDVLDEDSGHSVLDGSEADAEALMASLQGQMSNCEEDV